MIPSASIRNSNAAIFSEVIGLGTIKIKLESLKLTRPENLSSKRKQVIISADFEFFDDYLGNLRQLPVTATRQFSSDWIYMSHNNFSPF